MRLRRCGLYVWKRLFRRKFFFLLFRGSCINISLDCAAGIGIRDEFPYRRGYERSVSCETEKKTGFWNVGKVAFVSMHIEGKVLVGVKFIPKWPFIGRLRVCFAAPPYFQMTMKPIVTRGLNVTELPGIAGWIDNHLALVFEQTLAEPNMLVVDVEKFVSPQPENWFSVDAKDPMLML